MEKKEFLTICDSTLKGIGFIKKGGAYYLIHGSELVGAVYLRKSSYGSVYYVECELQFMDIMKHSHSQNITMLISQLAFSFP